MAPPQPRSSWFRRTVSWSNSRQSWNERIAASVLVLAGGLLWWLSDSISLAASIALWGLILLLAAVVLRRGWLKLFGPILFYDMIRIARRGRYVLMRGLYAGLLLFILFSFGLGVWLNPRGQGFTPHESSLLALRFFEVFMLVQLITVSVLTPAFVASSISEEKDRKTMEFLLATDLRNREIVLSKLGSRIANLLMFILTGLPILGIMQFLGGVDPTLVLTGFAATGMTIFGIASVSILNSVMVKKSRDAIAITYLYLIAYLFLGSFAYGLQRAGAISRIDFPLWFGDDAPTFSNLITWLNTGNLLIALSNVGMAGSLAAPAALEQYATFHGILAVVCISWAIVRVRSVALEQAYAPVLKAGKRHKSRAAVGDRPMLWKEISVETGVHMNWAARILVAILIGSTLFPAGWMIYEYFVEPANRGGFNWFSQSMNVWVRIAGTFVACLTLLGLAVRASASIGNERDKETFDSLLTSPLDSAEILWAKYVGTILSMRLAWLWLGIIWVTGLLTGGLHVLALPLLLAAWFIYASFFTVLGLWFSMVARTTMRATVYTVLASVGLAAGHWLIWICCGPLFAFGGGTNRAGETLAKFQIGLTPPLSLGFLAFCAHDFDNQWGGNREMVEFMGFSILGMMIWGVAALLLWFAALGPRFRSMTGRNPDAFRNTIATLSRTRKNGPADVANDGTGIKRQDEAA